MDQIKNNKPLLHDPLIANRVKQYLEENIDKRYVNIPDMIKHLQSRYPEYARRKQQPFKQLVNEAYRVVSQQLMGPQVSSDDSEQSDLEVMADSSSTNNVMNNMMNNLYNKQKPNAIPRPQQSESPPEAIDISSDESCDETQSNGNVKGNEEPFGEVIESGSKGSSVTSSTGSAIPEKYHHGQKRSEPLESTPQKNKKRKPENDPDQVHSGTNSNLNLPASITVVPAVNQISNVNITQKSGRLPGINSIKNQQNSSEALLKQALQNSNEASTPHNHHHHHHSKKKYKKTIVLRTSSETFRDIGGMESALKELCEILMHFKSPDAYFALGLMPPRGVLLHGPSGCGKTLLAHAIAGQLDIPICEVPATEFIAGVSGESEQRIRDIFEQAASVSPCLLFIDEIDAISSNRSMAQRDMERRVVSQLITSMDELKRNSGGQAVLIVGATTRPDALDPALRRVGRFDHEIAIGVPGRKERKQILEIICDGISVEPKCDFDKIAELTPGFVGADLLALVSRAAVFAVKRKCTEQLHAFQTKQLTIVDLDEDDGDDSKIEKLNASTAQEEKMDVDENNETTSKEKAEPENEKSKNVQETETEKKTETEPSAEDKNNDKEVNAESKINENDKTASKETEADSKDEDKEAAPEKEKSPAKTGKKESADVANDIAMEDDESGKGKDDKDKDKTIPLHDPTLCEMLNLLENPLDLSQNLDTFCIEFNDLVRAVKAVQPAAKREGFITVPDTTWDDVGSLQDIREELKLAVLAPVKYPDMLKRLGITAPSGVLLCGPPGCGKTLLAKAVANEAGINFISVKGPELMNMYVGESERAVRACFQRARNSAPCVIFFDEFDSLCPKRSDGNESGSGTRIVNQLLTEMDGIEERKGVYILAATNRPDIIDPAILRPGRLDTILYVGLPQEKDRVEILKATTKNGTHPILADDVNFDDWAAKTDGYTGADLAGLVKQASMLALKEAINSGLSQLDDLCVRNKHFDEAIKLFRPSVNAQARAVYDKLRIKYASPRILDE